MRRRANRRFETRAETLSDIFFHHRLSSSVIKGIADHPQFDDINTPLTALHFANRHLLKGKSFGQLVLAESKSLPNFRK